MYWHELMAHLYHCGLTSSPLEVLGGVVLGVCCLGVCCPLGVLSLGCVLDVTVLSMRRDMPEVVQWDWFVVG